MCRGKRGFVGGGHFQKCCCICCKAVCHLCLILFLVGQVLARDDYRPRPSLADVVLFCQLPLSSLNPSDYRGNLRSCVEMYVSAARPSFSKEPRTDSEEKIMSARRWRLERHILVTIGPSGKKDARQFAKDAPLNLEWEGMSEGPLSEATYTEQWLERSPQSPIAPFLHLFAAYRYRAGFETASREQLKSQIPIAAATYKYHLQAARTAGNEKITCIANDMEALPYVYLSGFGRP